MKICCFIDSLGSGGAQRQIVNLCVGLKSRGHKVTLLTYHPEDFFKKKLTDNHIEISTIAANNPLGLIRGVRKQFKAENPDAIVAFLTSPSLIACLASAFPHKWKLITGERNSKEEIFEGKKGKVVKWAERFSDWKVANSEVGRAMWVKYCPQYSAKISTIYNPVIIDSISVEEKRQEDDKRHIVVAASYQYTKNPVNVAKAVSLLSEQERTQLVIDWFGRVEVISGDKRAFEETQRIIEENKLQDVLVLHEETKEIYAEMRKADAIGLFSFVEGLPNAICEGMMLGKPVIMTPVSDYEKLCTKSNGILCKSPSAEDIRDALVKLIHLEESEIGVLGGESKRIAETLFDYAENIKSWEKLLERLVKEVLP